MNQLITVLLVDDEVSIRDGLKHIINWEKEGFRLIGEASNGLTALNEIQKWQPDIVITDLKMPQMDGIELTEIIHKQYPDIHFFILSSYDDFNFVSQAFKNGARDYLLKPTLTAQMLLTNLKRAQKKIAAKKIDCSTKTILQESLSRYLSGYEQEELANFESYFNESEYQILYTNTQYFQNNDQLFQAFESVHQLDGIANFLQFTVRNGDIGLLINLEKNAEILSALNQHFKPLKEIEVNAFFTLSPVFSSLSEMRTLFANLRTASQEQLFFSKKMIVLPEVHLLRFNNNDQFDTKEFLRPLLKNDFQMSIARIEDYFNMMILSHCSPSFLKQQASSIFYTLFSRISEEYPESLEMQSLKMTFLRKIGSLTYLEEFSQLLLDTIEQIRFSLLNATPEDQDKLLLSKIQLYIETHYKENLSLAHLAEVFHFSYNYLSSFLSENLNMSFSEYLKTLRLEAAKQLLITSDLNLSEISTAVGYSDLSYFSKLFKKEYQVTPSKYRRKTQLNEKLD